MNRDYLDVINKVVDEKFVGESESKIEEIKNLVKIYLEAEQNYEFNDERPRIGSLLDTLIK